MQYRDYLSSVSGFECLEEEQTVEIVSFSSGENGVELLSYIFLSRNYFSLG